MRFLIILLMLWSQMLLLSATKNNDPVSWEVSSTPLENNSYEIHIKAKIDPEWQIYSQNSPEFGALPTTISFDKDSTKVIYQDNIIEKGYMKRKYETVFETWVLFYKDSVDFIQVVTLKNNEKTNIAGHINYMACKNDMCLPPITVPFKITLNE